MKTPIRTETPHLSSCLGIVDADNKYVDLESVCDAINNAAAGPWEDIQRIPVPDGKQGQYLLFLYADNDVVKVSWHDTIRKWRMISGLNPPRENLVAFARINIPKKEKEK